MGIGKPSKHSVLRMVGPFTLPSSLGRDIVLQRADVPGCISRKREEHAVACENAPSYGALRSLCRLTSRRCALSCSLCVEFSVDHARRLKCLKFARLKTHLARQNRPGVRA